VMSLPAALQYMSGLLPGGLPALRERNHELAVRARALLMDALAIPAPCPAEMLGAMATLPLPVTTSAPALYEALWRKHRIEAPVFDWPAPGRPMLRVCAQIYNDLSQYQKLAEAVRSELR
jgi:isopenicillin-N epimerase